MSRSNHFDVGGTDDAAMRGVEPGDRCEFPKADVDPPIRRVVGIGASAGGLESIEKLLTHLEVNHLVVVVVQHMLRGHSSLLPHLLSVASGRRVVMAEDGASLVAGAILVNPPQTLLTLRCGVLRLVPIGEHAGVQYPSTISSPRSRMSSARGQPASSCQAQAPTARAASLPSRSKAASPSRRPHRARNF